MASKKIEEKIEQMVDHFVATIEEDIEFVTESLDEEEFAEFKKQLPAKIELLLLHME